MPKSSTLALKLPQQSALKENGTKNPLSPRAPHSPPPSGGSTEQTDPVGHETSFYVEPTPTTEFPAQPSSPSSPKHKKAASRSIFSNSKASKSYSKINPSEFSIRQVSDSRSETMRSQVYPYRHSPGSSPELGKSMENSSITSGNSSIPDTDHNGQPGSAVKSSSLPHIDTDLVHSSKRSNNNKGRFPNILARTRSTSTKGFEEPPKQKSKPSTPINRFPPEVDLHKHLGKHLADQSAKSAPLEKDRSFREMMTSMNSSIRNRSADRHVAVESEDDVSLAPKEKKEAKSFSSSFKDGGAGASFLTKIQTQGSKAADGIGKAGKAGKGFFGKLGRSGSSNERDTHHDENYVCKVINLPLVEQTRRTRISKRLEDSRDKTEFWMPALPWRCIDYLNYYGCEEEGLYRVPGSGKDIRHWQRRFDTEGDINLFDQPDLYDINIIGSMFKAWLRELPDEIFPKSIQARIAEQCAGAKSTPQMLRDELSKLPPHNYYLLFAITCHISLLHSCADKNKMDYRNLCICFQPCMKIEAFCFQFLVLDWKNCWQGCWTEEDYKNEQKEERDQIKKLKEQDIDREPPPSTSHTNTNQSYSNSSSISNGRQAATSNYSYTTSTAKSLGTSRSLLASGERSASSGSSRPSIVESATPERRRPSTVDTSRQTEHEDDNATPTQPGHLRINSELPALSPIKPLSPPWSTTRAP